ncbi:hypothetical protein I3I95_10725 [bacterium]|nr:hypothetical protein [bacterium]
MAIGWVIVLAILLLPLVPLAVIGVVGFVRMICSTLQLTLKGDGCD